MNRFRSTDGYAVATAMVLMAIMLTIGLAAFAFVDSETESSRRERTHESRLNLTEGVIAAEVFQMSRDWPTTSEKAYPADCTATATAAKCPSPAQLKAQFSGADFTHAQGWSVRVRDDVPDPAAPTTNAIQYYDDAQVLARPTYDANANGQMWVRAEGELKGKRRVVVARVRVEQRPVKPPDGPFVAGAFDTGNSGTNKVIIESDIPGTVRCTPPTGTTGHTNDCIDYGDGQITPINLVQSNPDAGPAIAAALVGSLKQTAIANNTYYPSGCPTDPSGDVVWVETGNCQYSGNMVVNGATKKGIFIVNNGTLELAGNVTWWGAIYALNAQNCGAVGATNCVDYKGYTDNVVTVTGTPTIHGAIYIDGAGRLGIGNSGNSGNCESCLPNLVYDTSVFKDLKAFGTAGIIQNTWRELTAKQ